MKRIILILKREVIIIIFYFLFPGIYHHVAGKFLGQITVRVIGWGINGNGVRYWLAANSWGTSWGENGFFKIRRGDNECLFEDYFMTGTPTVWRWFESQSWNKTILVKTKTVNGNSIIVTYYNLHTKNIDIIQFYFNDLHWK